MTEEVLEKTTRLDREIMYLLNKLKLPKPKPKPTPQTNETAPPTGSDTQPEEEVSNEADESSTEKTVDTGSEGGSQQEVDTEGDANPLVAKVRNWKWKLECNRKVVARDQIQMQKLKLGTVKLEMWMKLQTPRH